MVDDIQQYYYDDNIVAVHGGFTTTLQFETIVDGKSFSDSDLDDIIWNRNFIYNRHPDYHQLWKDTFGDRFLLTGHTAIGPMINATNPKWIMLDSASNLFMLIIDSHTQYRIIDNLGGVFYKVG